MSYLQHPSALQTLPSLPFALLFSTQQPTWSFGMEISSCYPSAQDLQWSLVLLRLKPTPSVFCSYFEWLANLKKVWNQGSYTLCSTVLVQKQAEIFKRLKPQFSNILVEFVWWKNNQMSHLKCPVLIGHCGEGKGENFHWFNQHCQKQWYIYPAWEVSEGCALVICILPLFSQDTNIWFGLDLFPKALSKSTLPCFKARDTETFVHDCNEHVSPNPLYPTPPARLILSKHCLNSRKISNKII